MDLKLLLVNLRESFGCFSFFLKFKDLIRFFSFYIFFVATLILYIMYFGIENVVFSP